MPQSNEIGSFEAKTKLAELLRETEQGNSFVILRRGKPVARLVPWEPEPLRAGMEQLVADFRQVQRSVQGPVRVRELIEEGRR